jgi:hypothetical protein
MLPDVRLMYRIDFIGKFGDEEMPAVFPIIKHSLVTYKGYNPSCNKCLKLVINSKQTSPTLQNDQSA